MLLLGSILRRPHGAVLAAVVLYLCVVSGGVEAQSDSTQESRADADTNEAQPESNIKVDDPELAPSSDDVIILMGKNGLPVTLPATASVKAYLKYVQQLTLDPNRGKLPSFAITNVKLQGEVSADESLAVVTATIRVELTVDDRVLVPLRLKEATLREVNYNGTGEAIFADFNPQRGYRYWIKGKGKHEIQLKFSVKVRQQNLQSRLQLSLPPSPVSNLKLVVLLARVNAKASERTTVVERTLPGRKSELELHGIGEELDLTWQLIPDQQETETRLRTTSLIHAELSADSIVLNATQTVRATEGSFDRIDVRLPAGFDTVELEERDFQVDPGDPNRATVLLPEPTKGPVELKWTISADDYQDDGGVPAIEGFEIENARQQIGFIAIQSPFGYRVTLNEDGSRFVRRQNVSDLENILDENPSIDAEYITSVYRFRKQPFRLQLNSAEIEPSYTTTATHFFKVSEDRATLDTTFAFQIDRGTVPEIEIDWSNYQDDGWVVEQLPFQTETSDRSITIRFDERKKTQFIVRLRAIRLITADGSPFSLSLPTAVAAGHLPATLVVAAPDNIPVSIESVGDTSVTILPAPLAAQIDVPEELLGLQSTFYRIESERPELTATATVNERTVRTYTTAKAELNDDRIQVEQLIYFDVSFGRLSQIRLLVPRSIAIGSQTDDSPWLFLHDGTPLNVVETDPGGTVEGPTRTVRAQLQSAKRGQFHLRAQFDVPIVSKPTPEANQEIAIGLMRSAESELASVTFSIIDTGDYSVSVRDESWTRQTSLLNARTWTASDAESSVPIELGFSDSNATRDFWIRDAVIKSQFEASGRCKTHAEFFIEGRPRFLEIGVPRSLRPAKIAWSRQNLPLEQFQPISAKPNWYRVVLPNISVQAEHVFSIEFESSDTGAFSANDLRELAPLQFSDDVRVENTAWEVTLPAQQYLLIGPETMSPDYSWQRQRLFWTRVPNPSSLSPEVAQFFSSASQVRDAGNSYRFHTIGAPPQLSFRSIDMRLSISWGLCWGLVVGMVLWKLPSTRHILTFLILALIVSVASIWYFEPIQLLWQPSVVGILLAGIGLMVDSLFRRKPVPSVVAFSSPSDILLHASTVDRPVLVTTGADDSTERRQSHDHIVPHESDSTSGPESEAV